MRLYIMFIGDFEKTATWSDTPYAAAKVPRPLLEPAEMAAPEGIIPQERGGDPPDDQKSDRESTVSR
jgi:hypothetical protein